MDGQGSAFIFIQCLSALQLQEESPAPLTMVPPALLPMLLLSQFLFSLCLRILRVPAPGTTALGNLPKGLLFALALPSSCFIGLGAHPKECLCYTGQGPGQAPAASCSLLQPCPAALHRLVMSPSEMEAAPQAAVNWSLECVDKSQITLALCQCKSNTEHLLSGSHSLGNGSAETGSSVVRKQRSCRGVWAAQPLH